MSPPVRAHENAMIRAQGADARSVEADRVAWEHGILAAMHFDFSAVVEAIGVCNTPASRRGHFLLGGHSRGQWIRNDDYRCRRGGTAGDIDVQVHGRRRTIVVRKVVAAEDMLSMKPLTRASAVQAEVPPMRLLTKASAVEAGVC